MRSSQRTVLVVLAAAVAASLSLVALAAPKHTAATAAATPPPDDPPKAVDISSVKSKLKVVSDGKKHYIVINPTSIDDEFFFYGDGKNMYGQRTFGGGSSGEDFQRYFWDPRWLPRHRGADLQLKDDKWTLSCGDRNVELKLTSTAEAQSILSSAKFFGPRWARQAYALARDDSGRYFYVDRAREPDGNKNFRMYAGLKGALTLQKMTNVVSDSEGDIFATKSGDLRVVLDRHETVWVQGEQRKKLINLPIEDNGGMIYNELGVYAGLPLGTPCDDM